MNRASLLLFGAVASLIFAIIFASLPPQSPQHYGPIDAVVDGMPVCAATKQDTGSRIVLDGVLRGPCNSTDVGRKP